jgi:glycosyltransferase involved in cell wall biosynthesis
MQKIIFIHLLNDYSGSPKVLSQVIEAAKCHGYEIDLYTSKGSEGFLSNLVDSHYTFYYKRFENKYLTLVAFLISQLVIFLKLLRYRNEDVIIYVNTMLPFGAGLAARIMGKKVVYHIHEISLEPVTLKKFLRYIIQVTASKTVFVSKAVAESELFRGIDQEVIYNALPKDFLKEALKHQYRWQNKLKFNVLMACSLKRYKGVDEFLKIASICEKNKNLSFSLILNASYEEINKYFMPYNLPKNLELIDRQRDLVPFYQRASILLNLSRPDEWVETFGLTILEAMAFGVPVIAPPVGGPVEILKGKGGFLISSYEVNAIAEKLMMLSENKELCLKLSSEAKLRAQDFSIDLFKQKVINFFSNEAN